MSLIDVFWTFTLIIQQLYFSLDIYKAFDGLHMNNYFFDSFFEHFIHIINTWAIVSSTKQKTYNNCTFAITKKKFHENGITQGHLISLLWIRCIRKRVSKIQKNWIKWNLEHLNHGCFVCLFFIFFFCLCVLVRFGLYNWNII